MTAFIGRLDHGGTLRFQCTPATDAERCRIAFTGYLANRSALLAVLRAQHESTATDAELVALAYRRWGEGAQAQLLGEYAFALFDAERGTLLLGHDALGLVPLFVSERGGTLTFATDLAELVGATGVGELDEEYIADCLALVRGRDERTPYRHIRRLLPGRGAAVRNGAMVTIAAYDPSMAEPVALAPSAEYAQRLRELIVEAIASSLPATGTVWSDLSGGLDSSTIVSIALGTLGAKLDVVSAVFGRSEQADETEWIDAVLQTYPAPSHRIDADTVPPFSTVPDRFHPEPNGAPIVAAFNDARDALLRAHGVGVVLTGACGDAVFFGDSPMPYAFADANPFALAGAVRRWAAGDPGQRSFAYWFQRCVVAPRLRRLAGAAVVLAAGVAAMDARRSTRVRWISRAGRGGASCACRRSAASTSGTASTKARASPARDSTARRRRTRTATRCCTCRWWSSWRACRGPSRRARPTTACCSGARCTGSCPSASGCGAGSAAPTQAIFSGLESGRAWLEMLTTRSALVERGYADPRALGRDGPKSARRVVVADGRADAGGRARSVVRHARPGATERAGWTQVPPKHGCSRRSTGHILAGLICPLSHAPASSAGAYSRPRRRRCTGCRNETRPLETSPSSKAAPSRSCATRIGSSRRAACCGRWARTAPRCCG